MAFSRKLAVLATFAAAFAFTAWPAMADPVLTPIITAVLSGTALAGSSISVFGLFSISTTAFISSIVTTAIGRGFSATRSR